MASTTRTTKTINTSKKKQKKKESEKKKKQPTRRPSLASLFRFHSRHCVKRPSLSYADTLQRQHRHRYRYRYADTQTDLQIGSTDRPAMLPCFRQLSIISFLMCLFICLKSQRQINSPLAGALPGTGMRGGREMPRIILMHFCFSSIAD